MFTFRRKKPFRAVAITIARNEAWYIKKHIQHLLDNGLEVVLIDNKSTDETVKTAESFSGKYPVSVVHLPYTGVYNLDYLLKKVMETVREIKADWFIFLNPDEFPLPLAPGLTLKENFRQVEREGYNSVNFDEFVFLPEDENTHYEEMDFSESMKHYYFFDPSPLHRVIAWKNNKRAEFKKSGGHRIHFPRQKIYPENFTFKHYIFLSRRHALIKYGNRLFSKKGIELGWHKNRVNFKANELIFPSLDSLKVYEKGKSFDRSDPKKEHLFLNKDSKFSRYKIKYLFPKNKSYPTENLKEELQEKYAIPFIIGFEDDGLHAVQNFLGDYFLLLSPGIDKLLADVLTLDDTVSPEDFMKLLADTRTLDNLNIHPEKYITTCREGEKFDLGKAYRLLFHLHENGLNRKMKGNASASNYFWIAGIQHLLPEAHFVHVTEDIRRIIARRKTKDSITLKNIEALTSEWLISIVETRHQSQFCRNYFEIKSEEISQNPLSSGSRMMEFLKVEISPAELQRMTEHHFVDKINVRAVNNFRNALTSEEHKLIIDIAGQTLSDLRYNDLPVFLYS